MNLDSNFSAAVFLLFGLLIGSFLNVVIYRLPQMMFRAWLADASENLASETPEHNLWHLVFQNKKPAPANMHHVAQEIGEALNEIPAQELLPFLNIKHLTEIKMEFVRGDGIGKNDRKITTDNSCFDVYMEYEDSQLRDRKSVV